MKRIFITAVIIIMGYMLPAQPANLDSVKAELYKVNKIFDSSAYLGFDVSIVYSSDTIYGKFEHEEMKGRYILNNRNVYYHMGDVEYAQNDSFVYNIYHDDKTMFMTKDLVSASKLFPLKEFVDSIINWYDTAYTITLNDVEDLQVIQFNAAISGLPYERFAIYYDSISHFPERFEMWFQQPLDNQPDVPDSILQKIRLKTVTKKITMYFSNYYNPQTLEVFDDQTYVSFDRIRKRYRPNEKFRSYRFLANGVNGDDHDETVELYPPPDEN